MNIEDMLKDTLITATNDLCKAYGIAPAYSVPNPMQQHKTYLDLGVLGEQVEAVVEWKFDLDQEVNQADIYRITITGKPVYGKLEVYGYLSEEKIEEIMQEIKETWSDE